MSFEEHMRDIVKTLGMQDKMIPVKDVYEARKADLLTVVKIKKSTWGSIVGIIWSHPKEDYSITQHHLRELLQGSDTVDFGHAACDQFVEVSHERKVGIGMEIEVPVNSNVLDAGGRVQKTEECSTSPLNLEMKSQKLNDVLNQLDSSQMNEKLIQRLTCSSNVKLGFIYEILRSPGPISLHRNVKGGGGLNLKLANVTKVGASACTMDNQKVTLPSNSTVAFTVHPLPTQELLCGTLKGSVWRDGFADWNLAGNFETTEQSVKEELVGFEDLSQPTKKYIRELLFRILATPQSLRPLDWMLEERCADEENLSRVTEELQLAVKELLTAAGLFPAEPAKSNDLLKPLGLLVSALAELNEEAVALMAAVEPQVLQQLFHLIEGVLQKQYRGEPVAPRQWRNQYPETTCQVAEEVLRTCEVLLDKNRVEDGEIVDVNLLNLYVALRALTMLLDV